MMHGREKSGPAGVAGKRANKAERSAAEPVERRAGAEGNAGHQSTRRAQNRESVSQALARIPFGPCPWLHRLRSGSLRLVRPLPRYSDRA